VFSLNSCFSNLNNSYTYAKSYRSLDDFYSVLEKDKNIIIMNLTLNPGETLDYEATIRFHADSDEIYEYQYAITHNGLTYRSTFSLQREESRSSGGQLFKGDEIDEEIIHEGLIIRTQLTPPTKFGSPLQYIINYYFEANGIGYYGEIRHVNEISENFDKQVFIDYVTGLYETQL
jgi:hypothetical protein